SRNDVCPRGRAVAGPGESKLPQFPSGSGVDFVSRALRFDLHTMTERRLIWLTGFILLWGAAIFLKLFILQVVRHSEYREIARARQELVVEIPAPRGNIFDRTGSPMAMSTPMESVFVNPLRVPDLGVAAEILSRILNLDNPSLLSRMKWGLDNHRGFLWIKRRISFEEEQRLRSLHLEWIEMQGETQRHYPKDSIAAHVLGS